MPAPIAVSNVTWAIIVVFVICALSIVGFLFMIYAIIVAAGRNDRANNRDEATQGTYHTQPVEEKTNGNGRVEKHS